ncbi:MAG: hypothetical protein J5641_05025, partial [Bacteroidales bacterium]|nr:hypothetical protein [Bacteroidales bacterium]
MKKVIILLISMLLLGTTVRGQVGSIGSITNTPFGSSATQRTNNPALPDSTATSDTASTEDMVNGIVYHEEIPDSTLKAAIFFFYRQPMQVKIMELEHPELTPTGAQFCDVLDGLNGDYY